MFRVIHVYYFIVPWVSHDQTTFIVNPRVSRRRPLGFLRPDYLSRNPRGLCRRLRGFSRPDHVSYHQRTRGSSRQNHVSCDSRVLRRRAQGFSRLQHVFRKSTCITSLSPRFLKTEPCFK